MKGQLGKETPAPKRLTRYQHQAHLDRQDRHNNKRRLFQAKHENQHSANGKSLGNHKVCTKIQPSLNTAQHMHFAAPCFIRATNGFMNMTIKFLRIWHLFQIITFACSCSVAAAVPKAAEQEDAPVTSGADVAKPTLSTKTGKKPIARKPTPAAKATTLGKPHAARNKKKR